MITARFGAPLVGALLLAAPAMAQDTTAVAEEAAPTPPGGVPITYAMPARDADGRWATPNRGLSAPETLWHLRAALNVAALGCRGDGEAATVAGYNALLVDRKAALAAASAGAEAAYQARHGEAWRQRHDDAMTRLYNFFAQAPARDAFCREARAVLAEQAVVEPSGFDAWSRAALERLEAPFTAFYDAFGAFQAKLAAWQASRPTAVAAVASTPTSAPAPTASASEARPAVVTALAAPSAAPVLMAAVSGPMP
ncbi:MAG TPA: hypothetical protein VF636_05505 [Sphingomonas sp.]|jgi:hypothetical protein